jgi:hypothetical protein
VVLDSSGDTPYIIFFESGVLKSSIYRFPGTSLFTSIGGIIINATGTLNLSGKSGISLSNTSGSVKINGETVATQEWSNRNTIARWG